MTTDDAPDAAVAPATPTKVRGVRGRELVTLSGLGITSLVAYGAWFYAYGVLVEAIEVDTGWSSSILGATYAAATLLVGVLATLAGRVLDRRGAAPVLAVGGVLGGGLLVAASHATTAGLFALSYGLGGGLVGALGFYHVTMAASARLGTAQQRPRNLALLTIWAGLASAIYLPITATLVEAQGWRATQRWLGISVIVAFLGAAWLTRGLKARAVEADQDVRPLPALRLAAADPAVRQMLLAEAVAGIGIGVLLVQQVPAMVDAGLAFTTAAGFAGARGLLQLAGRIPLTPVVARFGTRRSLVGALFLVGVSGLLLLNSSNYVIASLFALVAGIGLGAMSPLSGLYAQELFDDAHLGLLMGARASVRQVFWAAGPFSAGILVDATGSTKVASIMVAIAGFTSCALLARPLKSPAKLPLPA
ncbi:MAG: MFS family permease [Glaciecola sp.]|jgi:MFS family permease